MNIKIWGVRGSVPTPSTPVFSTSRYGGNTTCVSVHAPGVLLILDGGSGLRALGMWLEPMMPVHGSFFFSHLHWDHIQGFPFFNPGFSAGNSFTLYGPKLGVPNSTGASLLEEALRNQQQHFNFPIGLSEMGAALTFSDIDAAQTVELAGSESTIKVTSGALNHPGGCFGYRVEETRGDKTTSFVFATDTEHFPEEASPALQALASHADVLLYDAQYSVEEYEGKHGPPKRGWGHSTYRHGIREARAAHVCRLLLTDHAPEQDDW